MKQRICAALAGSAPTAAGVVVAAMFAAAPAWADTVTAPLVVQGSFDQYGRNNSAYGAGAGNVLVGRQVGRTASTSYRNYFVFDLSGLSGTVTSATFTISTEYSGAYKSPSASETWTLYDVADTSVPGLINQGASGQYGVYSDLGSGQAYAARAFGSGDDRTTVAITLDAAALQDIQSRLGGRFAIGGAITTLDEAQSEELFLFSDYGTGTSLRLTLGPAAAVPLPASVEAGVAILAPLALVRRYRRRRRSAVG